MSLRDLPPEVRAEVWHQVTARRYIHFVKLTYPAGQQPAAQGFDIVWPRWSPTASVNHTIPDWRMLPPDFPTVDPTQWFDHSRMARSTWFSGGNPSGYRLLDTTRRVNAEARREINWHTALQDWIHLRAGSGSSLIDIHTSDVLCIQLDTAEPDWTFLDPRLYLIGERQRWRQVRLDEFLLGSAYPDLMRLRRVAFEFDYTRYHASTQVHITGFHTREDELLWIVTHLPNLGRSGTIYFIDRSIRAQDGMSLPAAWEVFHASDGRYVEVTSALAPGWIITSGIFRFAAYFRQRLVSLSDACHALFQHQPPNPPAGMAALPPVNTVNAPNPNHPNHPGSFSLSRFPLAMQLCPALWQDAWGPQRVDVKVLAFIKD